MAVIEATQPMRTLSVVSRRSLLIGAAATAYVFVRVLFCVGATIDDLHPDIPSYRLTPSFTGANSRPWVVPSVQWLLSDSATVVVQAALSGVAFLALAYAIREQLTNTWVRNLAAGLVLVLSSVWLIALAVDSFVSVSDAPLGDERSRLRGDVGVCLSAG